MINLLPSYSTLLLVFTATLLLLGLIIAIRRGTPRNPTKLEKLLARPGLPENQVRYLVPLLVYEEPYPRFCEIVSLVMENFPLERFLAEEEFRTALDALTDSMFSKSGTQGTRTAMSVVVSSFLSDPDVEYRCRTQLRPLVELFLKEIEDS